MTENHCFNLEIPLKEVKCLSEMYLMHICPTIMLIT